MGDIKAVGEKEGDDEMAMEDNETVRWPECKV